MNSRAVDWTFPEERGLYRLLEIWPRINFVREKHPPQNPFGAEKAEDDVFVLKSYYTKIPAYLEIEREFSQYSIFVYGASESGKTATSFQLAFTGLCGSRGSRWFPVYIPLSPNLSDSSFSIQSVLKEIAKALLAYLTLNVDELRNLSDETLGAIVRSWIKYIDDINDGETLLTHLNANGLGSSRYFTEIEKRVKGITKGITKAHQLSREECFDIINKCIPDSFTSMRIILDLHINSLSIDEIKDIQALAEVRIFTLVFIQEDTGFTDSILRNYPKIRQIRLTWEPEHMNGLLKIRLNQIGEDTISSWCDPLAKQTMPDDRLIKASRGNPAKLIHFGNKLYEQINEISKEEKKLSIEDLDKILLDHQS